VMVRSWMGGKWAILGDRNFLIFLPGWGGGGGGPLQIDLLGTTEQNKAEFTPAIVGAPRDLAEATGVQTKRHPGPRVPEPRRTE